MISGTLRRLSYWWLFVHDKAGMEEDEWSNCFLTYSIMFLLLKEWKKREVVFDGPLVAFGIA